MVFAACFEQELTPRQSHAVLTARLCFLLHKTPPEIRALSVQDINVLQQVHSADETLRQMN